MPSKFKYSNLYNTMTKSDLQYYLFYGIIWTLDKIKYYWRKLSKCDACM